jgi:hypothetical protein
MSFNFLSSHRVNRRCLLHNFELRPQKHTNSFQLLWTHVQLIIWMQDTTITRVALPLLNKKGEQIYILITLSRSPHKNYALKEVLHVKKAFFISLAVSYPSLIPINKDSGTSVTQTVLNTPCQRKIVETMGHIGATASSIGDSVVAYFSFWLLQGLQFFLCGLFFDRQNRLSVYKLFPSLI